MLRRIRGFILAKVAIRKVQKEISDALLFDEIYTYGRDIERMQIIIDELPVRSALLLRYELEDFSSDPSTPVPSWILQQLRWPPVPKKYARFIEN